MMNPIQILIIEDEFILAEDLKVMLEKEGYQVMETVNNGKEAIDYFKKVPIDLVLCDIHIQGELDGIDTCLALLQHRKVPIIYLTSYTDKETIDRAKQTFPAAYISKPAHTTNLQIAIDLALNNFSVQPELSGKEISESHPLAENILQINDFLFVKQNNNFVKFAMQDVQYLEAGKMYTTIITTDRKYVVRNFLGNVLERIPLEPLIRIHRSYAVNLTKIDSFNDHAVYINKVEIPIGKTYKDDFLLRFSHR
jgi:DNA-binding LytR/AlgR family response regulator